MGEGERQSETEKDRDRKRRGKEEMLAEMDSKVPNLCFALKTEEKKDGSGKYIRR